METSQTPIVEIAKPSLKTPTITVSTKPFSTFSIKDAMKQTQEPKNVRSQVAEQESIIHSEKAFTNDDVKKALTHYITSHKVEKSIEIALNTYTPLIDGNNIVIHVDNQLLLDSINSQFGIIRNSLFNSLQNSHINLTFDIANDPNNRPKVFVTKQELLKDCIEKNPNVGEWIKILDLYLE